MANGTIWGHGAYLGPDFSATYLHNWAFDAAEQTAQRRYQRPYADLTPLQPVGCGEAWYLETSYSEHWAEIVHDFLK